MDQRQAEQREMLRKNRAASYNEEVASRLAKLESYVNYLAESLDKSISYSEYIADEVWERTLGPSIAELVADLEEAFAELRKRMGAQEKKPSD